MMKRSVNTVRENLFWAAVRFFCPREADDDGIIIWKLLRGGLMKKLLVAVAVAVFAFPAFLEDGFSLSAIPVNRKPWTLSSSTASLGRG